MKKSVNEFILNELKEYATYDNERSLPHLSDGLKTSQRKIVHTVFKTLKDGVDIKTTSLGASASNLTHYKHGENSIIDTVIGMAQDFSGTNNYPLLQKEGQFGTVVNNAASSPRYIFVRRGDKINSMFDKDDIEIVKYIEYDGDIIEPEYFLPKLPLIAINGSIGIGNGYACKIIQRDTSKVAQFVEKYLIDGEVDDTLLIPSFNNFTGSVQVVGPKSFIIHGRINRVNSNTTIIEDLPPTSAYQYEKYKDSVLVPLLTDKSTGLNEIINESDEQQWSITLKHSREFGNQSDEEMFKTLKLSVKLSETITVWGFDNKLKTFDCMSDLIVSWVNERKVWIERRKSHKISKFDERLSWLQDLLMLIEFWVDNPHLPKLKKQELITELNTITQNENHISKFLDQNILSLTRDRLDKLKGEIRGIKSTIKDLKSKTIDQMFIEDVIQFK